MYRTCPDCGANLDPGEICFDCRENENAAPVGSEPEAAQMKNHHY